MSKNVILASSSPRRKELLSQLGLTFEIIPSEASEDGIKGETHESYVRRIAELKADSVAETRKGSWVIGADTIVVIGNLRLGKPASREEARKMLELLSGKKHEVMTGIAVTCFDQKFKTSEVEKTGVWFKKLTPGQIENYLSTSEPYDKAGGYGIQGEASSFIEKIEGDISNVVGLPLKKVREILMKAGILSNTGINTNEISRLVKKLQRPGLSFEGD